MVPFPVNNEHWPGWQVLALYGAAFYLEGRTRPEDLPTYLSATAASLQRTDSRYVRRGWPNRHASCQ